MSPTGLGRHLPGRRGEHEPDGVGAQRHRQQGVGLGGDPADLHEHAHGSRRHRRLPRPSADAGGPASARHRRPAVGRPHQRLPHQHGLVAGVGQPAGVARRRGSPTRPRPPPRRGSASTRPQGPLVVHLEGVQVALVHPDELGPGVQGPLELGLVVHLDQGVEADSCRARLQQPDQLVVGQRGHDEQDGVGPHQPGVAHVGVGHGEVLAQHREPTRGPGGGQVARAIPRRTRASVSTDRQAAPPAS